MALTATLAPTFTLSFLDNNGNDGSMLVYFPASVNTVALALTRANAIRDAVRAATTAVITGGSLAYQLAEDDGGTFEQASDVRRKLFLPLYNLANPRAKSTPTVPSPIFTIEVAGTNVVDQTNQVVADLVAAMQANAVTNRGEALNRLDNPYIDVRERRGRQS